MLIKSIHSIQQHNDGWIFENYIIYSSKTPFPAYPQVFEGIDKNNQQPVIIKCILCKDINIKEFEATVNATPIQFPFILNLQHVFLCKENETLYLVFDKCTNSFQSYIATKKRLLESEALEIFFQVVEGCIWLWGNCIIHRSISPACIFYVFDENFHKNVFFISDFGASTFNKSPFLANESVASYMAPEIVVNANHDYLSDVWSLGLILHKLLFGEDYYSGANVETIKNKIMSVEYQLKTDQRKMISGKTAALLERMIKHDPKDRAAKDQLQKTIKEFHEYEFVRKILSKFQHATRFYNITKSLQDIHLQYAKKLMDNAWGMLLNGYYKISKDMNKEALKIYQNVLGEDCAETRHAMIKHAQDLMFLGKIEKAKIFGDKALELYEKNKNENDPDLARAYMIIGNIYKVVGNFKTSKNFLEKAVKMRLKINGEYYRDTATSLGNLAITLRDLKDLSNAKQVFERSIIIFNKVFGREYFEISVAYYNLSMVLYRLKDYKKALKFCQKAKKMMRNHFGNNHNRTAQAVRHELDILKALNKKNKSKCN